MISIFSAFLILVLLPPSLPYPFAISTTSPLTTILSTHPNLVNLTSVLLRHLSQLRSTCNHYDPPWIPATDNFLSSRGWPQSSPCLSRQVLKHPRFLFDTITIRQEALRSLHPLIRQKFAQFAPVCHPTLIIPSILPCSLLTLGAVRLNYSWYLSEGFTNHPPHLFLPPGERIFVDEFVTVQNNSLKPATMRLKDQQNKTVHNATTILTSWPGAALPGQYYPEESAKNPAVREALQDGRHARTAKESLHWGNAVTLLLPALLVLVPYAGIGGATWGRFVVWVMITDVLVVSPVIIKGADLAMWERREFVSVVTTWREGKAWIAEISVARCALERGSGWRVALAGFMLGAMGVALEYWAWQRRKKC